MSGAAALLAGLLLLMALLSLITAMFPMGASQAWLAPLQNNWLIVLFQVNAGLGEVQFARLHGLNPLDIALLALAATSCCCWRSRRRARSAASPHMPRIDGALAKSP